MRKRARKVASLLLLLIMICGAVITGVPPVAAAMGGLLPDNVPRYGGGLYLDDESPQVGNEDGSLPDSETATQDLESGAASGIISDDPGIEEEIETIMAQAFADIVGPLAAGYGSNGKFLAPIEAPLAGSIPISNRAQLENIKNNLSGNYHLTADIDLSGAEWIPVGDGYDSSFTGTFDGQGHVISNLTITGYYEDAGLFGCVRDGVIKNIGLENLYINVYANCVGGICGVAVYSFPISNCFTTGSISASSYYYKVVSAGGISGISGYDTSISDCYNTGSVFVSSTYGSALAGGITSGQTPISDCYNTGSVSASSTHEFAGAGGISCQSYYPISNCYNTGPVSATSTLYSGAGGIDGGGGATPISNCYNTGSVSASASFSDSYANAGGISGGGVTPISNCYNTGSVSASASNSSAGGIGCLVYFSSISNCYNTGSVSASASSAFLSSAYAGGISADGNNYTIDSCYNISSVSASSISEYAPDDALVYAGGISGYGSAISNSYWMLESDQIVNGVQCGNSDKRRSGEETVSTVGCLTSTQMKSASNFAGFNFSSVWGIDTDFNNGYPYLRGVGSAPGDPGGNTDIIAKAYADYMRNFSGLTRAEANVKATSVSPDGKPLKMNVNGGAWCAAFVNKTAKSFFGNFNIIPEYAGCKTLYTNITKKLGGKVVTDPQPGDLVFFDWKPTGTFKTFAHIGVVVGVDVQKNWIDVVHGNWGHSNKYKTVKTTKVCGPNCESGCQMNGRFWNYGKSGLHQLRYSKNGKVIADARYVRPDYSRVSSARYGTVIMKYKCPVDVLIEFDDEELNSATNTTSASWGTLSTNGGEITATLDYGNPYGIIVTGYDTGVMSLEIEFDTNDGQYTHTFTGVPITSGTEIDVNTNAAYMGVELVVTEDGQTDESMIWYAEPDEAVTEADADLTSEYYSQNMLDGFDDIGILPGDVSGDDQINMQDVLMVYQNFRGKVTFTEEELFAADVNCDGSINMADVLLVYQYFRGKITELPAQ